MYSKLIYRVLGTQAISKLQLVAANHPHLQTTLRHLHRPAHALPPSKLGTLPHDVLPIQLFTGLISISTPSESFGGAVPASTCASTPPPPASPPKELDEVDRRKLFVGTDLDWPDNSVRSLQGRPSLSYASGCVGLYNSCAV